MSITEAHRNRLVAQGRDEMMTAWMRSLPSDANEAQQRDAAARFEGVMVTLIEELVGVISAVDFPAFAVKLDNLDGKGKVVLKAANMDKAGPVLITHMGSSLTLVLTDVEQFDERREQARIELDQPDLPLEVEDGGEDFAEEAAEIADEADPNFDDQGLVDTENGAFPRFTVVEAKPLRLHGTNEMVRAWTVVHGDAEVFAPIGAENFVNGCADKLNEAAISLERDLTPDEVRSCIQASLQILWDTGAVDFAVSFVPPYSEDAPAVQDNAPAAAEEAAKPKRSTKTAAEKVEAYFAGYDGAASDLFADDCPHERGALKDNWIMGLEDAKAGKSPRWNRPTQPAANDDGEPRETTGNMAA